MGRARSLPTILARRGELIAERDRLRPSGRLLRQDGMDASYIDLADPRHLEFDYMRWMRIVLRAAHARRVLHVGGGACALARALAAENAGAALRGHQEVCELDPDVLSFAREHFGLRRTPGLRVRCAEGRAFLARQPDASWDAVVIDAFVAAAVPPRLTSVQALGEVARVAPLALLNVLDDRAGRQVRSIAAAFGAAYPYVWTLAGRAGNRVLVGSACRPDLARIAAQAAADPSPARLTPPVEIARLTAGAVPPADPGVEPAGP